MAGLRGRPPRIRLDPRSRSRAPARTRAGSSRLARARSPGSSPRRGRSRSCPRSEGRRGTRAARRRRGRASPARASARREGSSPSTKRVTSHPSGSTNATTSGPMPSAAAARVASSSTVRSMPSRSVSLPVTRRTNSSPSTSTLRLWFVIPPPRTSNARSRPGQTRSTAAASSLMPGSARPAGSKSGSAAISPATHSPKISTSTSRADAVLGRHVCVRDRLLDRVAVAAARHAADELVPDADRLGAERDGAGILERQAPQQALGLGARASASRPTKSPLSSLTAKSSPASNGVSSGVMSEPHTR